MYIHVYTDICIYGERITMQLSECLYARVPCAVSPCHVLREPQALQQTATHGNTLQHTATHCNSLQHTATHFNALQRTATY